MNQGRKYATGIYTVADDRFFPGIVAMINSLRYYGSDEIIVVIDIGLEPWMQEYLLGFPNVELYSLKEETQGLRYLDRDDDENPALMRFGFKAIGISLCDRLDRWVFMDADYLPLSNVGAELFPLVDSGHFLAAADGLNFWHEKHQALTGILPGIRRNINSGLLGVNMNTHQLLIEKWHESMLRCDVVTNVPLADQGCLNLMKDLIGVEVHLLDNLSWNQVWMTRELAIENQCFFIGEKDKERFMWHRLTDKRIFGYHALNYFRLWYPIGIDLDLRRSPTERTNLFKHSLRICPPGIVAAFEFFLFLGEFNQPLKRNGHLLAPS